MAENINSLRTFVTPNTVVSAGGLTDNKNQEQNSEPVVDMPVIAYNASGDRIGNVTYLGNTAQGTRTSGKGRDSIFSLPKGFTLYAKNGTTASTKPTLDISLKNGKVNVTVSKSVADSKWYKNTFEENDVFSRLASLYEADPDSKTAFSVTDKDGNTTQKTVKEMLEDYQKAAEEFTDNQGKLNETKNIVSSATNGNIAMSDDDAVIFSSFNNFFDKDGNFIKGNLTSDSIPVYLPVTFDKYYDFYKLPSWNAEERTVSAADFFKIYNLDTTDDGSSLGAEKISAMKQELKSSISYLLSSWAEQVAENDDDPNEVARAAKLNAEASRNFAQAYSLYKILDKADPDGSFISKADVFIDSFMNSFSATATQGAVNVADFLGDFLPMAFPLVNTVVDTGVDIVEGIVTGKIDPSGASLFMKGQIIGEILESDGNNRDKKIAELYQNMVGWGVNTIEDDDQSAIATALDLFSGRNPAITGGNGAIEGLEWLRSEEEKLLELGQAAKAGNMFGFYAEKVVEQILFTNPFGVAAQNAVANGLVKLFGTGSTLGKGLAAVMAGQVPIDTSTRLAIALWGAASKGGNLLAQGIVDSILEDGDLMNRMIQSKDGSELLAVVGKNTAFNGFGELVGFTQKSVIGAASSSKPGKFAKKVSHKVGSKMYSGSVKFADFLKSIFSNSNGADSAGSAGAKTTFEAASTGDVASWERARRNTMSQVMANVAQTPLQDVDVAIAKEAAVDNALAKKMRGIGEETERFMKSPEIASADAATAQSKQAVLKIQDSLIKNKSVELRAPTSSGSLSPDISNYLVAKNRLQYILRKNGAINVSSSLGSINPTIDDIARGASDINSRTLTLSDYAARVKGADSIAAKQLVEYIESFETKVGKEMAEALKPLYKNIADINNKINLYAIKNNLIDALDYYSRVNTGYWGADGSDYIYTIAKGDGTELSAAQKAMRDLMSGKNRLSETEYEIFSLKGWSPDTDYLDPSMSYYYKIQSLSSVKQNREAITSLKNSGIPFREIARNGSRVTSEKEFKAAVKSFKNGVEKQLKSMLANGDIDIKTLVDGSYERALANMDVKSGQAQKVVENLSRSNERLLGVDTHEKIRRQAGFIKGADIEELRSIGFDIPNINKKATSVQDIEQAFAVMDDDAADWFSRRLINDGANAELVNAARDGVADDLIATKISDAEQKYYTKNFKRTRRTVDINDIGKAYEDISNQLINTFNEEITIGVADDIASFTIRNNEDILSSGALKDIIRRKNLNNLDAKKRAFLDKRAKQISNILAEESSLSGKEITSDSFSQQITRFTNDIVDAIAEEYSNTMYLKEYAKAAIQGGATVSVEEWARFFTLNSLAKNGLKKEIVDRIGKYVRESGTFGKINGDKQGAITKAFKEAYEENIDVMRDSYTKQLVENGAGDYVGDAIDDLMATIQKVDKDIVEKIATDRNVVALIEDGATVYYETTSDAAMLVTVTPNTSAIYNQSSKIARLNRQAVRVFRDLTTAFDPKSYLSQWAKDPAMSFISGGLTRSIRRNQAIITEALGDKATKYMLEELEQMGINAPSTASDLVKTYTDSVSKDLYPEESMRENYFRNRVKAAGSELYGDSGLISKEQQRGITRKVAEKFDGALKFLEDHYPTAKLGNMRESYLRRATYTQVLADSIKQGLSMEHANDLAKMVSRNATTDFNQFLLLGNKFVHNIPYLSAAFSGSRSFWKLFIIDPVGVGGRLFGGLIVPAMMLWEQSLNNPDNAAIYGSINEYEKDTHLIFIHNGTIIKIPIPEELQTFFQPFRKWVEKAYGASDDSWAQIITNFALGIPPVNLSGLNDDNLYTLSSDPTFADRLKREAEVLLSQWSPNVFKTAYMAVTQTDPLTGNNINNERVCWNETTGKWETIDNTESQFARGLSSILRNAGIDVSPFMASKLTNSLFGNSTVSKADTIINLLQGNVSGAVGEIGEHALSGYTTKMGDQASRAWYTAVAQLEKQKRDMMQEEGGLSDIVAQINRLDKTDSKYSEKLKMLQSDYMSKTEEYRNSVIKLVQNLKNQFGESAWTRQRLAATISLLTFNEQTLLPQDQYEQNISSDEYYWGRNMAIETMKQLGFTSPNDNSILGYTITDENGNIEVRYQSPLSILNSSSIWSDGDRHTASLEAIAKANNINRYKAMQEAGYSNMSKSQKKKFRAEWNERVAKALAPYIQEHGVNEVLSNSSTRKYLNDVFLISNQYQAEDFLYAVFGDDADNY